MRVAWVGLVAIVAVGCGGKEAQTPPSPSVVPPAPQEVVLAVSVMGDGVVRAQGLECRAACVQRFTKGTRLSLQASPDSGATFGGWSGACSGQQACELTLDADAAVDARFTRPPPPPEQHQLTVQVDGHGSVRSSPSGIDCGSTCAASFLATAQVALTPAPEAGYSFAGWNASCNGSGGCIVLMSSDARVIARFEPLPPKMVSVTMTVNGPGRVTGNGLDCPGSACAVQVSAGTTLGLTAWPGRGARLISWGRSECASSSPNCNIVASQNISATMVFENEVLTLAPADGTNYSVFAINATHVFFQRSGNYISGIWSVPKAGGTASMVTSMCCAVNMVADQDYVYWNDWSSTYRVPTTGGSPQQLYYYYEILPGGLVLDGATLYWTSHYGSFYNSNTVVGIYSGSTSGGTARLLATAKQPSGIAVDSQYVYWSDKDRDGLIQRVPKAGGVPETVIDCGTCSPSVVRVDSNNIYYRNIDGDGWSRAKRGGDFHKLTSGNPGNNNVYWVDLEVNASVAYWTWNDYSSTHGLFSARADGTGWTAIETAADNTWVGPRVDDNYIFYWHAGALYRRLK
jgi:hypothetical protein